MTGLLTFDKAQDFKRALAFAVPFSGTDKSVPSDERVVTFLARGMQVTGSVALIDEDTNHVILLATDRYTAGVVSLECNWSGDTTEFAISQSDASRLVKALGSYAGYVQVRLDVTSVKVEWALGTIICERQESGPRVTALLNLIAKLNQEPQEPRESVQLDCAHLSRVLAAYKAGVPRKINFDLVELTSRGRTTVVTATRDSSHFALIQQRM